VLDIEDRSGVTIVRFRHGKVHALDLELLKAITAAVSGVDDGRSAPGSTCGASSTAGQPTSGSSCLRCPRPSWPSSTIQDR
jgi:hypothetical protein